MSQFTGFVFDAYDDTDGEILRSSIPEASRIPGFVKEAQWLGNGEGDALPDDSYALVMLKNGSKLRKYATVDKGNTALSVLYLLKQAYLLPESAVKTAATNLMEACERHGLPAPRELKVAAALGVSEVSGKSQNPILHKEFNRLQKEKVDNIDVPNESTVNPELGKGGVEDDVKTRANVVGVKGTNPLSGVPIESQKEKTASEDAVHQHSGLLESVSGNPDIEEVRTRKQNWRTSPYEDMQDWEPGFELQKTASAPEHTLLDGKYPVDSYAQVKEAQDYFMEHMRSFHPRDRQTYCTKLAERARVLDIPVQDTIEKYASDTYSSELEANVQYRRSFIPEEFHPSLDMLLEKVGQVDPHTFAESLCELDQMTNLHHEWDAQIPDPWASTFGTSTEKLAEASWVWDRNGARIREDDLNHLAANGRVLVSDSFGERFAEEFGKNPKTFFEALPDPNKLVLARMAMDRNSGTGTNE